MADMDTYDDQRGYEGNYITSGANAIDMPDAAYGYYGRREFDNQLHQTRIATPLSQRHEPRAHDTSQSKG